ncbi:hypothetical protein JMJ56_28385 [Belnapia sp. T18]|uniref:Phasin protein n=1 Tax=Belnapia arida TaxID=2804533 RepID=A0ABS1UDY2_9PROT|nr:hypothetical protein [Belnapia arida]MBL6081907.1 hypothetical protein [Belnapia arida]
MEKTKHDLVGMIEEAAANMRRLMTAAPGPGTVGEQAQEAQRAASLLVEGMMATNKRFAEALLNRAEPSPAVELQKRFVGDYFDALARGGTLVMRAAGEAAQSSKREAQESGHREGGAPAAPTERSEPAPQKRVRRPRSQTSHKNTAPVRRKTVK